jgi:hypothetical protein
VSLPVWIVAVAIGAGCTTTRIVWVGRYIASHTHGTVTAGADDGARQLRVVGVTGPDSDATPTCKSWSYDIGEHADLIWPWPGDYRMRARVSRIGHPDFFISGRVTVENWKCYLPAMACDNPIPNATSCRLILEPRKCQGIWFPDKRYPASYPARRCEVAEA